MRKLLIVAVILLPAVADARERPAGEEEKDAASHALVQCLGNQAMKNDDRISDATSIAAAIAPACGEEGMALSRAMAQGANDAVKQAILLNTDRRTREIAANVVLQVRAQRRQSQ